MGGEDGSKVGRELTFGVVLVREIGAVRGARDVHAPEGAAVLALPQPGKVDVHGEPTVLEGLREVRPVDVVPERAADEDGEVVVPICGVLRLPSAKYITRCADSIGCRAHILGRMKAVLMCLCS